MTVLTMKTKHAEEDVGYLLYEITNSCLYDPEDGRYCDHVSKILFTETLKKPVK